MAIAANPRDKVLRYRWLIFWILACCYVLVYFHRLCTAVVAVDMMRDLKAGGTLTGFLAAAYFYPYALMQLPAGLLSDSWGPRNTVTLFFGIAAIGSLVLGLAPSAFWAIFGRTMVGVGVAMLFVPTMKILAEWFRKREFATMTAILIAMGGIGSLTAETPLALLSEALGWRKSFLAVGGVTFLLVVLVWLFVRDRPADFGWSLPGSEKERPADAPMALAEGVRRVLQTASFWPAAAWFFFDCAIFFSFGGLWGGPYLMQVYGLTRGGAGQILSMLAIGMIFGSPMLSYLSNSVFRARKPVIVISSLATLIIAALLAFYTDKLPMAGLYGLCLAMGCFSSAVVVVTFTTVKELFPVQIAGTAIGLVNLFPFAGGAVFQPILGYVLESQGRVGTAFTVAGYRQAFLLLLGCAVVAFLSSLFLKETMTRA